jgi:hypothetical protein
MARSTQQRHGAVGAAVMPRRIDASRHQSRASIRTKAAPGPGTLVLVLEYQAVTRQACVAHSGYAAGLAIALATARSARPRSSMPRPRRLERAVQIVDASATWPKPRCPARGTCSHAPEPARRALGRLGSHSSDDPGRSRRCARTYLDLARPGRGVLARQPLTTRGDLGRVFARASISCAQEEACSPGSRR